MASFQVVGGKKLQGDIIPQGAKNEALQVICATLLSPEAITIHNIPQIRDVKKLIDLLRSMGVKIESLGSGSFRFQADQVDMDYLESEEFNKKGSALRGSVMILGPLLARFGKARMPKPGGDKIGRRRLDTHFLGFEKLGAVFQYDAQNYTFDIHAEKLKGTYMLLDEASVTGTANIIMTAVTCRRYYNYL